jgi:hypothetical protein
MKLIVRLLFYENAPVFKFGDGNPTSRFLRV